MRGVDGADDLGERRPAVLDAEAVAGVADRRRFVPHRLEQPRHAVPLGRRAHQHRNDVALAQFTRQIVENEVLWRLEIAEQLLHQRVVVVGELLEHRIARVFLFLSHAGGDLDHLRGREFAVDERALEREIDKAGRNPVLPHRDLAQEKRRARGGLQEFERLAQASARLIDLVEEQDARQAELLELAQDHLKRRDLARVGLAYDDRGVADRQRRMHVVDELDRSRAVEEGQPVAHIVDARDIGLDAHGVAARFLAESPTQVPSRTVPCRASAPPRANIPSRRLVFPLWNGPTIATRRGPGTRCSVWTAVKIQLPQAAHRRVRRGFSIGRARS